MLVRAISGIFLQKILQRSQGEIYLIGVMLIDHGEPGVWAAFHFSPRRLEPALHDAIVAIIVCALTIHSLALWMVVVCDPPAGIGVPPRPRRASSDPPAAAVAVVPIGDAPGRAVRGDAPPSTLMRGCRGIALPRRQSPPRRGLPSSSPRASLSSLSSLRPSPGCRPTPPPPRPRPTTTRGGATGGGEGRREQTRHIRLLFTPHDHIVIEYPLTSILMPHGPSHRFIVFSGGAGRGGRATGAPPQEGLGS